MGSSDAYDQAEPDSDLVGQAAPDYNFDQRVS